MNNVQMFIMLLISYVDVHIPIALDIRRYNFYACNACAIIEYLHAFFSPNPPLSELQSYKDPSCKTVAVLKPSFTVYNSPVPKHIYLARSIVFYTEFCRPWTALSQYLTPAGWLPIRPVFTASESGLRGGGEGCSGVGGGEGSAWLWCVYAPIEPELCVETAAAAAA